MTATLLQFRADHDRLLREAAIGRCACAGSRSGIGRRVRTARTALACRRRRPAAHRTAGARGPLDAAFWGDTEVRLPSSDGRLDHLLAADELVLERPWCRRRAG